MKDYIKFKFNGGNGAVLCSNCSKIIMSGARIPKEIWEAVSDRSGGRPIENIPPMFCCDECREKYENRKTSEKSQ